LTIQGLKKRARTNKKVKGMDTRKLKKSGIVSG
jgi:hypothetical protein